MIVVVICVGGFILLGFRQASVDYDAVARMEYQTKQEIIQQNVSAYLADHPIMDEGIVEQITQLLDAQEEYLQGMIKARFSEDWKEELRLAIQQGEGELALSELGGVPYDPVLPQRIAFNRYLLSNSIPPKTPTNKVDGLGVLCQYIQWIGFFVGALFPMLLAVVVLLLERETGEIRFLLHIPVTRRSLLAGKCLGVLILSLVTTLIVPLALFVGCSALFGIGDPRYPLVCLDGSFLSTATFLWQSLSVSLVTTVFFTALGSLLATMLKNTFLGVVAILSVTGISFLLQQLPFLFLDWFPLCSADVYSTITQSTFPLWIAVTIQLISIAGILIVNIMVFEKKDRT